MYTYSFTFTYIYIYIYNCFMYFICICIYNMSFIYCVVFIQCVLYSIFYILYSRLNVDGTLRNGCSHHGSYSYIGEAFLKTTLTRGTSRHTLSLPQAGATLITATAVLWFSEMKYKLVRLCGPQQYIKYTKYTKYTSYK